MKNSIDWVDHVTRAWQEAYDDMKPLCAINELDQINLFYLNEIQKTFFAKFKPEIECLCEYFKIPSKKAWIEQRM